MALPSQEAPRGPEAGGVLSTQAQLLAHRVNAGATRGCPGSSGSSIALISRCPLGPLERWESGWGWELEEMGTQGMLAFYFFTGGSQGEPQTHLIFLL